MTADVIQDRRVTVPTRGFINPAFVDGSRLYWALPSRVHEGLGVRACSPTGYKVMRCSPHAFITAQSRIMTSCCPLRHLRSDPATLAACDKKGGPDPAAPLTKTHQRASYGLASMARSAFCLNPALNRRQAARSLRRCLRARSLAACVTPNPCLLRGVNSGCRLRRTKKTS